MSDGKSNIIRKATGIASATFLSRILGLLRTRMTAEVLGGGTYASAWFLAFAIPNLLRRILGEGALGNAVMPIIADADQKKTPEEARKELAVIFGVSGILLALAVLLVSGVSFLVRTFIPVSEEWHLILHLLPMLMPYAFFICLVGVSTAVLNYAKTFILPAYGSLLLNIAIIAGLYWGYVNHSGEETESIISLLEILSVLVVFSGVIHLSINMILLKHCGWFPDFSAVRQHLNVLKPLWKLALPGVIGGAATQISFLVDRFIAVKCNSQAVAALTYTDRIIDLPIGLLAVSFGQVLMARMSRAAAADDIHSISKELNYSAKLLLYLSIPMAAGVVFFHVLALKVICLGGNYTMNDLDSTSLVAVFYGCGIPLFCLLKILIPAFNSRKKMNTTLFCSLIAIGINIFLSILLMFPLQQGGIALATVISSTVNTSLLLYMLHRDGVTVEYKSLLICVFRSLAAAVGVSMLTAAVLQQFYQPDQGRLYDFTAMMLVMIFFAAGYFSITHLTGASEFRELIRCIRKRD